jgi:hypothetical protein
MLRYLQSIIAVSCSSLGPRAPEAGGVRVGGGGTVVLKHSTLPFYNTIKLDAVRSRESFKVWKPKLQILNTVQCQRASDVYRMLSCLVLLYHP